MGSRDLRFDGWTLRRDSGELLRGDVRTRLQRQPVQVLEALLERPGEVVTREELRARLWPTGVVDFETALNSTVRRLRRALGDDADAPRYIETLPRRGYRFIGRLDSGDAAPDVVPNAVQGALHAALPSEPSEHASVPWPRSRRVILAAASTCAAVLVIGVAIGARFESVGRVSSAAPAAVSTEHSDPRAARQPTDASATGLDVHGASAADEGDERMRRAKFLFQRRMPGDVERARALYEDVIAADPANAAAHAGLAGAYWILVTQERVSRDAGLERVRASAERALALDSTLADAHMRLMNYAYAVGDRGMHRRHAMEYRRLARDAGAYSAAAYDALEANRPDEAIALARRGVAAEPLAVNPRLSLAFVLYAAGRYDDAARACREAHDLNPLAGVGLLATIAVAQGRYADALGYARSLPAGAERSQALALAYHGLARRPESDRALAELVTEFGDSDPLRVAEVYAFRGDTHRAGQWIDAGIPTFRPSDRPSLRLRLTPWMLRFSPFMSSMRADARWAQWVATPS